MKSSNILAFLKLSESSNVLALDPFAANYISRVEAADGQPLEPAVKVAMNQYFLDLQAAAAPLGGRNNLESLLSQLIPGARTLAGSFTPLVDSMPTPANFGPFVSGDYNRVTGWKGDGTTKAISLRLSSALLPMSDNHIALNVVTHSTLPGLRYYISDRVSNAGIRIGTASFASGLATSNKSTGVSQNFGNRTNTGFMLIQRQTELNPYIFRINDDVFAPALVKFHLSGNWHMCGFGQIFGTWPGSTAASHTDGRLNLLSAGLAVNDAAFKTAFKNYITALTAALA